jgi:hypothetical protein
VPEITVLALRELPVTLPTLKPPAVGVKREAFGSARAHNKTLRFLRFLGVKQAHASALSEG